IWRDILRQSTRVESGTYAPRFEDSLSWSIIRGWSVRDVPCFVSLADRGVTYAACRLNKAFRGSVRLSDPALAGEASDRLYLEDLRAASRSFGVPGNDCNAIAPLCEPQIDDCSLRLSEDRLGRIKLPRRNWVDSPREKQLSLDSLMRRESDNWERWA